MSKKNFEYQSYLQIPPKYRLKSKPIEGGKVVVHKEHIPIGTNLEVSEIGSGGTVSTPTEPVQERIFPYIQTLYKNQAWELSMPVTIGKPVDNYNEAATTTEVTHTITSMQANVVYTSNQIDNIFKKISAGKIDMQGWQMFDLVTMYDHPDNIAIAELFSDQNIWNNSLTIEHAYPENITNDYLSGIGGFITQNGLRYFTATTNLETFYVPHQQIERLAILGDKYNVITSNAIAPAFDLPVMDDGVDILMPLVLIRKL